ncbi:hypothetical protein C8R43DRAFT_1012974 [Mycena crocata]|nr:hypothetical protein C8R43DRAFT_1012974 [Mycena crocata]
MATRIRLAQIEKEIAQLEAERRALVESLAFSVTTLPVEITSQIFLSCLPDNPFDTTDVAVVLTCVCRHWKDVAVAIPQLWSAWSLAIDSYTPRNRIKKGVETWLARSQNHPLSIRLHHKDGAGMDVSPADERWWERLSDFEVSGIMELILQHRQRWKNIQFNLPLAALNNLVEVGAAQVLPQLEHLTLGSIQEDWSGGSDDQDEVTLFLSAPRLRSLDLILEASFQFSRLDNFDLPWMQLTTFTGTNFTTLDCLFLLEKTPALIHCVFYISRHALTTLAAHIPEPTISQLKSLELRSTVTNARSALVLQHLTLPGLETLVLARDELDIPPSLTSLSLRSSCTILHFSGEFILSDELSQIFEALPSLRMLELEYDQQQDAINVIRHLYCQLQATPANDGIDLPNLQSLALQCRMNPHDGDTFPFNSLFLLLDILSSSPNALRRFRMTWTTSLVPRRPNRQESADLQTFVEGGMDIYIGTEETSWI